MKYNNVKHVPVVALESQIKQKPADEPGDTQFTVNTAGGSLWGFMMLMFYHPYDHCCQRQLLLISVDGGGDCLLIRAKSPLECHCLKLVVKLMCVLSIC